MRIQESDDELFQDVGRRGQQRERFKKTVPIEEGDVSARSTCSLSQVQLGEPLVQ